MPRGLGLALFAALFTFTSACKKSGESGSADADASATPPWATSGAGAPPRAGMRWIPPGTLIVGTPLDVSPRVADAEMAGEQLVMTGFYIDIYPWPNEAGALPKANLSRDEAVSLCTSAGKRLCSEIELERACKGPNNTVYPYGNTYKPDACGTGAKHPIPPNGYNDGCVSHFGVSDLQGSVWTWTSSDWGRGTEGLVTLRGGNSEHGEIVGRCANGSGAKPDERREDVGLRCCAGAENTFQIMLSVDRGEPLKLRVKDEAMAKTFEALIHAMPSLAEGLVGSLASSSPPIAVKEPRVFDVERSWTWHPIGNEELLVGGGCAKASPKRECGVLVAQLKSGELEPLAFVSTGSWQPILSAADTPRQIFVHGGDDNGAFRKRVSYEWGKVSIADKERKHKRGKRFTY
ncbi:MAG: SUMF1/EgtB/PvdO family nonheme iron enzyme [Polyangiaceae bacterium]